MGGCKFPEHHRSSGGDGLGGLALVLLGVVLLAAFAGPVGQAVSEIVTVIAITVGALVGLALLGAVAVIVVRVRRRRRPDRLRAVPYRVTVLGTGRQAAELRERTVPAALPEPRADVPALLRTHVVTGQAGSPRCVRRGGRRS